MHTLIRVVDWGDLPPIGVAQSSLCIYELNQRRVDSTTVHKLTTQVYHEENFILLGARQSCCGRFREGLRFGITNSERRGLD